MLNYCMSRAFADSHLQKKQLQTGFLHGMEYVLGVTDKESSARHLRSGAQELGEDAVEADALSESTKALARDRYQRLFWEPVKEGQVRLAKYLCIELVSDVHF